MAKAKTVYLGIGIYGIDEFLTFDKNGVATLDEFGWRCRVVEVLNAGVNVWRFFPGASGVNKLRPFHPFAASGEGWDLSKYNQNWFDVMKRAFQIVNRPDPKVKKGALVSFELLDNCQVNGPWRTLSPWHNNVNGVDTFYSNKAYSFVDKYIEECYKQFSGLAIEFGACNEGAAGIRELCAAVINPVLKRHGKWPFIFGDTFKPFYSSAEEATCKRILSLVGLDGDVVKDSRKVVENDELWNQLNSVEQKVILDMSNTKTIVDMDLMKVDLGRLWGASSGVEYKPWKASHGCTNSKDDQYIYPLRYWKGSPFYIMFSDDAVFDGESPCDWNVDVKTGKRYNRPGPEWSDMVTNAIAKKNGGGLWFEHTPERADVKCQVKTLKIMAEAFKKATGKYPSNWMAFSKPVKDDPIIEPIISDPPIIEPEIVCSPWYWLIPRLSSRWPFILINFKRFFKEVIWAK